MAGNSAGSASRNLRYPKQALGANTPRNSRNTVKERGVRCSPGSHDGMGKDKDCRLLSALAYQK